MSDDEILAVILGLLILTGTAFALIGWVIPMRDGVARYTFRYLAWGAVGCCWWANLTPWRWGSILPAVCLFIAIGRIRYWWRAAERAREVRP